jgi:hypothetical protein
MTITHRKTGTPEYLAWINIKRRCYNTANASYPDYGERGIVMCDRWKDDFLSFLEDMGERPSDQHSIDRIDVNGNYEPSNCRWAIDAIQRNNKRNNVILTHEGKTQTLAQWAKELGINTDTLWRRINVLNMTVERALTSEMLNTAKNEHGTRNSYERLKCRCDVCKQANTERHRQRRAKLSQESNSTA